MRIAGARASSARVTQVCALTQKRVPLALAALSTSALFAIGCGVSSTATPSLASIRSALAQRGVEVCNSTTVNSRFHGASQGHWYALSHDCSSSNQAVVLGVIPFDSKADRDAAYSQSLYSNRFIANNIAVLRFGNSVVLLTQIHNREVARQAIGKLESLGAR
jgi:hypothetical protein